MNIQLIDRALVSSIITPRRKDSHKGDYGHGALIAGSKGMMGAAALSARGFVRGGGGKLTSYVPSCGYIIMQTSVPEAMCITAGEEFIVGAGDLSRYDAVGIGPGMGQVETHPILLQEIFTGFRKPMVIDADALNVIAKNQALMGLIPVGSILTPHAGEFDRLFGQYADRTQREQAALQQAAAHQIIIVLKGAETFIALPNGTAFKNTTGNPGMATGGSGDVLTGILTALLAQQFKPEQAAAAGVFLHGLAGDIAAAKRSQHALIASDIIEYLGDAFLQVLGK